MAGELQRVPETSKDLDVLKHAITINQIIGRFLEASISIDHGTLTGLADDDHTQYYNATRLSAVLAGYVTDAELTTALSSYVTSASLTTTLSSYYTIAAANAAFAPISHTHTTSEITNLSSYTGFDARYFTETEADARFAPISHTHTASQVTDFSEAVDDRVSSLLVAGTNITLTYNDGANTLTIDAAGGGGAVATDAIWDAAGDLAVGSGANTASRLPVGADGEVLTVVSGAPAWAAATGGSGGAGSVSSNGCYVRRTGTAKSISNSTLTAIDWDTEVRDDNGYFSSSANTRLTIPESGWYEVGAAIDWASSTTAQRYFIILLNGSTRLTQDLISPASGGVCSQVHSTSYYFTAGDYVEIVVFQNSGAALDLATTDGFPRAWIHRLGGALGSDITLSDETLPAAPAADKVKVFSYDAGNVGLPMFRMPLAGPLPLTMFGGLIKKWSIIADGSQADLLHYGTSTNSGSLTGVGGTMTGSTLLQFHPHYSLATSASANQIAGGRWTGSSSLGFYRNYTTNSKVGGGYFHFRFAYENALSTGKLAVGLVSTTATVGMGSGVQPSAQVSCIMLGADEADTNLQFMHNDGSGTCTKVDTGVAKTALTASLLDLYILLDRNGNAKISLHNLENGNKYSADITTDLPADNVLMYPKMFTGNGATATAVTMRMYGFTALDPIGSW